MIDLPDKASSFEYENGFYLTCDPSRIGKLIAHYELYKKIIQIPGAIFKSYDIRLVLFWIKNYL